MPNQRSKDKSYVSLWIASADKARLKAAAKAGKITLTQLVENLLEAGVAASGLKDSPDPLKDSGKAQAAAKVIKSYRKDARAKRKSTKPAAEVLRQLAKSKKPNTPLDPAAGSTDAAAQG